MQSISSSTRSRSMRSVSFLMVFLLLTALAGCGGHRAPGAPTYDPIEKVNRGSYWFNDKLDRLLLKPLSQGYTAIMPKQGRVMVSNFFDNALYMDTILNDFLQGKGAQGVSDVGRFTVNSTIGVAGLFDPATPMGLEKHQEDFGQTLGVWGVGQGAYLVFPVYGPNTARDAPGLAFSTATSGVFWAGVFLNPAASIPISILAAIDLRSRASNAIRFVNESALDPYVFTREAWVQHRTFLIYDGNPPEDQFQDDFGDDELDSEDSGFDGASLN